MKRHSNIPVFIPHLGCPHTCVFCDQHRITGSATVVTPEAAEAAIDAVLATLAPDTETEIAFFGGSFTGIGTERMNRFLSMASRYVEKGRVSGIRFSTRPDYISPEILAMLEPYPVSAIELGIQSMDDEVLRISERGASSEDALRAMRLIREAGYPIVTQLMVGLPGATAGSEIRTADICIREGASAARIYPTVVIPGTKLARMEEDGSYHPLTLDEAVLRSARVLERFEQASVPVLRIGLCSEESLSPVWKSTNPSAHPAIGALVRGRLIREHTEEQLSLCQPQPGSRVTVRIAGGMLSCAIGNRGENRDYLTERFRLQSLAFMESGSLKGSEVRIDVPISQ